MDKKQYWTGKKVLITGASSGLGKAIVEYLAPYGVYFGLLSRRQEKLQELAVALQDSGSQFWIQSCDVRDREQVTQAVSEFQQETGALDVAWINSGVGAESSFRKWNWENIESLIDTNFKGAVYTTYACLNIMSKQAHGVVIGIGSAASMRGLPRGGMYSATKIALDYYFESMAIELPHIQFTMIHPGFVDTPLNSAATSRPWLIEPEKAADLMVKAVMKGKSRYIYPWQMKGMYHVVRMLPEIIYRSLARRLL